MSGGQTPTIVHVIPRDGIGGVEVAARSMLTPDDSGCTFRLLPIAGQAVLQTPRVVESRHASLFNPAAHLAALRAILRLRPDVLVCSLWWSVPVCVLARLLGARTRLVLMLHSERPHHFLDRVLTRLGITFADEIWSDSPETIAKRRLPATTPKRVVSFVTERLEPVSASAAPAPHFVCWARIVPEKGFDRAIALIALIVARGIDARYSIFGPDGGERAALERQVGNLGLEANVAFRGPVDRGELRRIAEENSFFLQLSRFEGMAMGAVEAMQLGLVPVVTAVGQMKDYVGSAQGLVVDPGDLPAAADDIAAVLANDARYGRLRQGSIAHWRDAPLYVDDFVSYARALAASVGEPAT